MTDLPSLKNIGPKSAEWLESVGIHNLDVLIELGVLEAYRRVSSAYPNQVTPNLLYALQGAMLDLKWNELPSEMMTQLRQAIGK